MEQCPKHTAYIDILVKMDTDDENYVDFTVPPKKLAEKYIENGTSKYRYESLPIGRTAKLLSLMMTAGLVCRFIIKVQAVLLYRIMQCFV